MYHIKLRKIPYIVHLIRAACVLNNISIVDQFVLTDDVGHNEILPEQEVDFEHGDEVDG